jgi:hypothetical protein
MLKIIRPKETSQTAKVIGPREINGDNIVTCREGQIEIPIGRQRIELYICGYN